MSELYHWGIKGQRWGERRYQNSDGSLTTAGRLRYGVGQGIRGGVFDSSNTLSKRAKRLGNFGIQLAKAKAYQHKNAGRYQYRQAKAGIIRSLRGKEKNKEIARINRRRMLDYDATRHLAKNFIKMRAADAADYVKEDSSKRFQLRMSAGKRYVDAMSAYRFVPLIGTKRSSRSRGVLSLNNIPYEVASVPNISRVRKSLAGSSKLSRWS